MGIRSRVKSEWRLRHPYSNSTVPAKGVTEGDWRDRQNPIRA